jgi:DNA-binding MarR family transcriptional regulator
MFNLEYIRYAETFYALQVPIYYYVKTKGSLANQNLSITNTVKMKLTVFEYYHRFFKTVLDEEEYEKSRLKVYRFLLDAAGDGAVPPAILPGSQKLGEERTHASPEVLGGAGALSDAFRDRKLLERYLETAALKNDLSLTEAKVLLSWKQIDSPTATRKELADFAGISRRDLTVAVQRLSGKGLLAVETVREEDDAEKRFSIKLLPAAAPVLSDLETAEGDYGKARTVNFTAEEQVQYAALREKIRGNIQAVLQ